MKILILGAGIMQYPAIQIAKEMGLHVVVADGNKDAQFVSYADDFVQIDLKNKEAIADLAVNLKKGANALGGVFTAGTDFSTTVAYACEKAGLPGIPYESALNASDKERMRRCFAVAGVPSPRFKVFRKGDALSIASNNDSLSCTANFSYPIVVKPVDNMGGRGCRKCNSEAELRDAVISAFDFSRSGRVIAEEFMEGPEYSIDAIAYNGEITICGIADRHIFFPPHFIEMGHTMPALLDEKTKQDLVDVFMRGVKSLGITMGAAKGDIKLTKNSDGAYTKPAIGEIAARLSGGYMSGWTFPYSSGIEVTKAAILIAIGKSHDNLTPVLQKTSAERAFISIPGKIAAIKFKKNAENVEYVEDLFFRVEAGSKVTFPENNVSKCGNVISAAPSRKEAVDAAEKAVRTVLFELEYPNNETENFLFGDELGCSIFPPCAFPVSRNILEQLERLPASSLPSSANKNNQICILSFNDFEKSNIKDYLGRSIAESIDAVRKITNLPLPIKIPAKEKINLATENVNALECFFGKEFWHALIRGTYQGASYTVAKLLGGAS
ncbi:MAG: ATP-grasp domain-containing protein [Termitinemataceae bacterium]|nr:MAG: ATP-grasp domain-containing protein [Termitinemataceae bacterium]